MNHSKKSMNKSSAGVDRPVNGNFAIFNSQFCNQAPISNVLNFENSFIKNSMKIGNWKLEIAAVVLVVFALFPTAASAALTDGLVPLEVQPASGLAVAIGDLLLTGLVGYSTFDGKDTNWGTNKTKAL